LTNVSIISIYTDNKIATKKVLHGTNLLVLNDYGWLNLKGLNMKAIKRSEQLQKQYQQFKKKLVDIGPVCQGSVIERCYNRSVKGKQTPYGPYYSWTRKVANKTVTVALSKGQYRHMSKAITAHRKVEDILKKMCAISEELVMLQAQGVVSRKSG